MLFSNERFTDNFEKNILMIFKSLNGINFNLERSKVVQAIGLGMGHWYKCPKGHFYAIGDCGAPNQAGNCIECKTPVGGGNRVIRGII